MSELKSNHGGVSISFSGLLTVAFIVLKLTHVITWKWIWVLAPLWVGIPFAVLLCVAVIIAAIIAAILDS